MRDDTGRKHFNAVVIGVASAVPGYFIGLIAYTALRDWLTPVRHAEEMMGRGIEVALFGGPLVALAIAGACSWTAWRAGDGLSNGAALAIAAALLLLAGGIAKMMGLF